MGVSVIWVPHSLARVRAAWFDKFFGPWASQVHETLNGINLSSGFNDMRSAKSGPWASPYGADGQMIMTVHNYRPIQFHRTSNEKIRQAVTEIWVPQFRQPPAHPPTRAVKTIPTPPPPPQPPPPPHRRGLRGKKHIFCLCTKTIHNNMHTHIHIHAHTQKNVNSFTLSDTSIRRSTGSTLVQLMACLIWTTLEYCSVKI